MSYTVGPIRAIFENEVKGKQGVAAVHEGLDNALRRFNSLIGLADDEGYRNVNENGEPFVDPNARIKAKNLPLGVVSEAIGGLFGRDWQDVLGNERHRTPQAMAGGFGLAQENVGNSAVQPGAFTNINAWGNAFGGLLEATALEAYHAPDYIGDMLFETQRSVQRSERMPGVSAIGDVAEEMTPGQPHPRVQIGERYVDTPITKRHGLGMDITREAVLFDPMGTQLLAQAEDVGRKVRLRKEKRQLETALGLTNTYKYNGTSYNTYATSGNWINKLASNELLDWTDIDAALNLFADMTDQETGESVAITGGFQLLVMPYKLMTSRKILRDTTVESRTPTTQGVVSSGSNPLIGSFEGDPIASPIAYNLLQSTGGISATNARDYWFIGQFKRAFKYKQNFPLTVSKITANSYQMEDNGLVLSLFASEMGAPAIIEPRYVVQCYKA